ncbi:RAM signaling pathway protein-domain-containing protein [Calycina marina]|uniref:RAM signaling pathway protein-domain-containing protein n=1 Tax=Calycina marina TaxID=1763456 RepID=A0A9P7YVD3_9HELO|nr:RAM signaling pathway protein-domain-containing protein [Calycina marina]
MESVKISGPPLGAATQSTGRPYLENGLPRPAPLSTIRRTPQTNGGSVNGNGNLRIDRPDHDLSVIPPQISVTRYHAQKYSGAMPENQVVARAKEALREALDKEQVANVGDVATRIIPSGVTIELHYQKIALLPEGVVDVIKDKVERLALSHNLLSTIPARFNECHALRYINLRNNQFREIPLSLCQLFTLEILDLGRNKLKVLPPEIQQLTSLKVLALERNRIEVLPTFLGDMKNLSAIRVVGNPMREPPLSICAPQLSSPNTNHDYIKITGETKEWLRHKGSQDRSEKKGMDRSETESGEEELSEGHETPRPTRRVSGRFPIRTPNDPPDARSPALSRAPPIPNRSHYRGLSAQNAALRRPSIAPLAVNGSAINERLRSNSENVIVAQRNSTASDRSRRMGIVSKKSDLDTVNESAANRYSHYRGLSHGSAMSGSTVNTARSARSPASPAHSEARSAYVRRLSSLPERKRMSMLPNPAMESAKGLAYVLYQIQPHLDILTGLTRHDGHKRISLEAVIFNASTHFLELEKQLVDYESCVEDDEEIAPLSSESVYRACLTAITAYQHVCSTLQNSISSLLDNGDPRFIRTLLVTLWGGIGEINCAARTVFANPPDAGRTSKMSDTISTDEQFTSDSTEGTMKSMSQDKAMTPPRVQTQTSYYRSRGNTLAEFDKLHNGLRVDNHLPEDGMFAINPALLSAKLGSVKFTSAEPTPRSGDSFTSVIDGSMIGEGFTEEDAQFEKIYLCLHRGSKIALSSLPQVKAFLESGLEICAAQEKPELVVHHWETMIELSNVVEASADALRNRLSSIQLREPEVRTQSAFWKLCVAFFNDYHNLAAKVRSVKPYTRINLAEIVNLLALIQTEAKACARFIQDSPWSAHNSTSSYSGSSNTFTRSGETYPMTPQSATLGPAIQATVPSTPHSASSFNAVFNGNIFQRADTYLSTNNSVAHSRSGTMTSNDSYANVISPSSATNPNHAMNIRFNGGRM